MYISLLIITSSLFEVDIHFECCLTLNYMDLYEAASYKMLHVVTPSLSVVSSQPSTSKHAETSSSADKAGPAQLDFDEMALRSRSLSSTLHKLYLWEKKLYNEVKVCFLVPVISLMSLILCSCYFLLNHPTLLLFLDQFEVSFYCH